MPPITKTPAAESPTKATFPAEGRAPGRLAAALARAGRGDKAVAQGAGKPRQETLTPSVSRSTFWVSSPQRGGWQGWGTGWGRGSLLAADRWAGFGVSSGQRAPRVSVPSPAAASEARRLVKNVEPWNNLMGRANSISSTRPCPHRWETGDCCAPFLRRWSFPSVK